MAHPLRSSQRRMFVAMVGMAVASGARLAAQTEVPAPASTGAPPAAVQELTEPEPASIDKLLEMFSSVELPPAPPSLEAAVQFDLRTQVYDIPIPLNPRVLAYIALFQGRLHDFIQEGLERAGRYLPM